MPDSLIYTMGHRPYCERANALLKAKGQTFGSRRPDRIYPNDLPRDCPLNP